MSVFEIFVVCVLKLSSSSFLLFLAAISFIVYTVYYTVGGAVAIQYVKIVQLIQETLFDKVKCKSCVSLL